MADIKKQKTKVHVIRKIAAQSKQQGSRQGIKQTDEKRVSAAIVNKRIARDEINVLDMDESSSYAISKTTLRNVCKSRGDKAYSVGNTQDSDEDSLINVSFLSNQADSRQILKVSE